MKIKAYGYTYPELWANVRIGQANAMTAKQLAETVGGKVGAIRAEMYRYFNTQLFNFVIRRIAYETDTGFRIKRKKIKPELSSYAQNVYWAEKID